MRFCCFICELYVCLLQHVSQDYILQLHFHHCNLLAFSWREKAALVTAFEVQLVLVAEHIIRKQPELITINQIADMPLPILGLAGFGLVLANHCPCKSSSLEIITIANPHHCKS